MPGLRGGMPQDGGVTKRSNSVAARRVFGLAAAWLVVAACEAREQKPTADTAAAGVAHVVHDEADREFLALMISHHTGMLAIAEAAMAAATGEAKVDAAAVFRNQSVERDSMSSMLRIQYADLAAPAISENFRIMADSLRRLAGGRAGHAFYDMTIGHHREGIALIDDYAPRLSPSLRAMASKMKSDQTAEIAEFQRKAGDVH